MKCQVDVDYVSDDVIKVIESRGESWEVFPGALMQEIDFKDLEDLHSFMSECESVSNKPLQFITSVLPVLEIEKSKRTKADEEPMLYITVKNVY